MVKTAEPVTSGVGPAADYDERYGRTPERAARRRMLGWVGGIAVALVFAAWVVWAAFDGTGSSIQTRNLGFTVVDDSSIRVSFEVSAPVGSDVSCAIEAQSEKHAIAGWKVVHLPTSDQYTRTFTETVRTVEPAVTGIIHRCW